MQSRKEHEITAKLEEKTYSELTVETTINISTEENIMENRKRKQEE